MSLQIIAGGKCHYAVLRKRLSNAINIQQQYSSCKIVHSVPTANLFRTSHSLVYHSATGSEDSVVTIKITCHKAISYLKRLNQKDWLSTKKIDFLSVYERVSLNNLCFRPYTARSTLTARWFIGKSHPRYHAWIKSLLFGESWSFNFVCIACMHLHLVIVIYHNYIWWLNCLGLSWLA